MRLQIIQHESFEAPAAIAKWAENKGHAIAYTRLYLNEQLPSCVNDFDLLVVMGGPQSPATTVKECPHFNAKQEIDFIRNAINKGKAVLGVCLGAQLIGEALGAKFDHSPNKEIGVFELTLTEAGKRDPFFSAVPPNFLVGHWHGDMPGLTESSEVLAYSEGCPRQIVRYSPKVYGFQCHFEFTPDAIQGMIDSCSEELEKFKSLPYIESVSTLKSHDFIEINRYLYGFLDYIESTQNVRDGESGITMKSSGAGSRPLI